MPTLCGVGLAVSRHSHTRASLTRSVQRLSVQQHISLIECLDLGRAIVSDGDLHLEWANGHVSLNLTPLALRYVEAFDAVVDGDHLGVVHPPSMGGASYIHLALPQRLL